MPHRSGGAEAAFTHRPGSSDSGALGALQAHAQSTLSSLRTESGKITFFHCVNNFSLLLGCICSELFLPVVIYYDISKETDVLSKLFGHLCIVSLSAAEIFNLLFCFPPEFPGLQVVSMALTACPIYAKKSQFHLSVIW